MKKFIDSDKEHHQVLLELGLLDDMDNWELFQQQDQIDESVREVWTKYMKPPKGYTWEEWHKHAEAEIARHERIFMKH